MQQVTQQSDNWSGGLPQKKRKEPKKFVGYKSSDDQVATMRLIAKKLLLENLSERQITPNIRDEKETESVFEIGPHAQIIVDANADVYGMILPTGREEGGATGPWLLSFVEHKPPPWWQGEHDHVWTNWCRDTLDHPLTQRLLLDDFLRQARSAAVAVFGTVGSKGPKRVRRRSHKRTSK